MAVSASMPPTFARAKICQVTFEAEGPGVISAETDSGTLASGEYVAKGTDVSLTAVPESLAKVVAWYVDGAKQEGKADNAFTLSNVQEDVNVKVEFAVPDRTVTVTAGDHGSVSFLVNGKAQTVTPENGTYVPTVSAADTVTILAVPDKDCSVTGWTSLKNATASGAISCRS